MDSAKKENQILSGNTKVDSVYYTLEWLITAFAGTLVFIIFIMQVYRIPTGSMAETLRGAHFRLRCTQCGYRYDHDFIARNYQLPDTYTPTKEFPIWPHSPVCPSCGFAEQDPQRAHNGSFYTFKDNQTVPAKLHTVYKGDQIFVLKSIYQFFKPQRWDSIVFKNPQEPPINYIKRCIGLPGETVQLIDGDVFINGRIARKPEKVQEELWMVLFNNDYVPSRPQEQAFYSPLSKSEMSARRLFYDRQAWHRPFEVVDGSKWDMEEENGAVFRLDSPGNDIQLVRYQDDTGFRATYAYDDPAGYFNMPIVGDLMVQYYLQIDGHSGAGAQIRKRGITYQGWVLADGTLRISTLKDTEVQTLAEAAAARKDLEKVSRFRFSVVDQQIVLEFGEKKLVHDLGTEIQVAGTDTESLPEVYLAGFGSLQLTHIGIFRDIHYTLVDSHGRPAIHAIPDKPMVLKEGEYFACGDNSPASFDSRFWAKKGLANAGQEPYNEGVVPEEYLVGKAFFVHWPGGYRVGKEPIRWIPYPDGMKVIYGGRK